MNSVRLDSTKNSNNRKLLKINQMDHHEETVNRIANQYWVKTRLDSAKKDRRTQKSTQMIQDSKDKEEQ